MRGSSSTGCNGAKDTPIFSASRNKRIMSNHQQDKQADNKKSGKILTTSKSRNSVQTLNYGFFSLNAPLVSISEHLFRFLRLGRSCLSSFFSSGLGSSGSIPGFLRSFEFGFKGRYASIGRRQSICSMEKGKRKSNKETEEDTRDRQKTQHRKEDYPQKLEQLSKIRHIRCPKRQTSSSKSVKRKA
jgi:hypothetical protein